MTERSDDLAVFAPWLARWRLLPDGAPFASQWSRLLPVRRGGAPLMLKAAMAEQEVAGSRFLQALDGQGAVRVFEREADAVLMERAAGAHRLGDLDEDEALETLCGVGDAIHSAGRAAIYDGLVPLDRWLDTLPGAALERGGTFVQAAGTAQRFLATTVEMRPLHGDLHHGNVLDARERGWLAIDPKGLLGDRAFDHALMAIAPDPVAAQAPGVLRRRAGTIGRMTDLEPGRLLDWVFVQASLYAAWYGPSDDLWPAVAAAARR